MHRRLRLLGAAVVIAAVPTIAGGLSPVPEPALGRTTISSITVQEDEGYPIESETIVARCERCHEQDDAGRMTRISYERKTPEGWQTSLRRMVALNNLTISPDEAREVVRYLANEQGLAPEELEPGRFEVERRLIDHVYEADPETEWTCIQCHSMGRVITQRRTREEWELLLATHRGLYPLVDFQAFRRSGPAEEGENGAPTDRRHPMDRAVDHLSAAFPLDTPEWSAWKATMRPPRLAGTWALDGYEPGKGRLFGTVTISEGANPDEFETRSSYTYAETGETVSRTGSAIVYTGHQWRGRSNPGGADELREVMSVERGWDAMSGRWFSGAYDEHGPDITLRRLGSDAGDIRPRILGVHPPAVRRGAVTEVRVWGYAPLDESDFGPGVTVTPVGMEGMTGVPVWTLSLDVDNDAALGPRDLYAAEASLAKAIVVHDGVDRLEVTPATGMARVGGANFPKGYQVFDAIGWNDGPDGEPETGDDLRLGRVPVEWSLEEYAATYDDDDVRFVGSIDAAGVFTPNDDGPNPERRGNRNNVGDVWVTASFDRGADRPLRARAHLLVTVPLYMRFDPWQAAPPTRLVP
ncbi:MAG: quinohemoprotein amine dehydrogenase subunit alpha [Gemmatimonadota bacterium]|nr:quinohemoprotein amine dehydrogenase subunit alpha [Gemmatimonadota bacterium]